MGRFADAADKGGDAAKQEVEKEITERVSKVIDASEDVIAKLLLKEDPETGKLVNDALTAVAMSTSKAEKIAKFKEFAAKGGVKFAKFLKKAGQAITVLALVILPSRVFAQEIAARDFGPTSISVTKGPLELGGIAELIGQKIKEAKGAALLSFDLKVGGALYLPIWKFHNKAKTVRYAEFGAGGIVKQGEHAEPLVNVAFNARAYMAKMWDWKWAREHVTVVDLPPIFVGPYVRVPMPGEVWKLKTHIGFLASVELF